MEGISRRTMRRLSRLSPSAMRDLLRVLTAPPNVRADVIRQFHEREGGRAMADALIDLESDELLRLRVIDVLRRSLGAEGD